MRVMKIRNNLLYILRKIKKGHKKRKGKKGRAKIGSAARICADSGAAAQMQSLQAPAMVNDGCGDMDLLSRLPDDVLCHILSFLRAKSAVEAKLLSRRWRHLYPASSVLRFFPDDVWRSFDILRFFARVDKSLRQFRAPRIALKLFLPDCLGRKYARNVDELICRAWEMKVESIDLHFDYDISSDDSSYIFPFHLLRTAELSHLKYLEVGSCSLLPLTSLEGPLISLRTLKLYSVSFCQSNGSFDDIASYFPNLENLAFEQCGELPSMRHLCGRLHCLKSLSLRNCIGSQDFEIHDLYLTNLLYHGSLTSISLKGLNCLQSLDISAHCCRKNVAIFLSTLPEGAPRLKSLSLCMVDMLDKDFQFPTSTCIFKCLKYLHLKIVITLNTDLQNLLKFLEDAPLLEKLRISLSGGMFEEWSLNCLERQLRQVHNIQFHPWPEQNVNEMHHVHSFLNEVVIRSRCYLEMKEVELAFFLLKNVTSIKKMVLYGLEKDKQEELQRALSQYKAVVRIITFPPRLI